MFWTQPFAICEYLPALTREPGPAAAFRWPPLGGRRWGPEQKGKMMNNVIPMMPAGDDGRPCDVSPYVAETAASTRTEIEARFEHVQRLAREYRAVNDRCTVWFRENYPNKAVYGTDEYVRFEVAKQNVCMAVTLAKDAYYKAADEFFLNADEREHG